MTTFQDPPPQSRRSARQSERSEEPDAPTGFADQTPPSEQTPIAPSLAPVFSTEPVFNAASTEPAELAAAPTGDEQPLTRSGRRAREAAQQGLYEVQPTSGEPLDYMTQGRDEPLSYQAPEPQLPPVPRPEAQAPPTPPPLIAPPEDEPAAPLFRVRDFSPEGRVTGRRAAAPPLIEPGSAPAAPPSDLDYRTEAGPTSINIPAAEAAPVPAPPIPSQPVAPPAPVNDLTPAPPATLTRRELRAKFAEDSAVSLEAETETPSATESESEPEVTPVLVEDASLITGTQPPLAVNPSLITGTQPPLAENPSLITGSQPPPPVADAALRTGTQPPPPAPAPTQAVPPSPPVAPPTVPTVVLPSAPAAPAVPPPAQDTPQSVLDAFEEFEELSRTGQLAPPSASARVTATPVAPAPNFLDPLPEPELDPDLEDSGGWVPPIGHWSRQADLDDETQPWENTVTREVGGGNVATTTSALVLPEMPRANTFPPALNATGEILLTGSIELPRSVSSVGGDSRHFDDSDVDLMFDDRERDLSGTDSSPVSAIRAVSTHTSARGVISSANKPHGNRMLTVLLITAAVMAVGVAGLLIAGLAGRIF